MTGMESTPPAIATSARCWASTAMTSDKRVRSCAESNLRRQPVPGCFPRDKPPRVRVPFQCVAKGVVRAVIRRCIGREHDQFHVRIHEIGGLQLRDVRRRGEFDHRAEILLAPLGANKRHVRRCRPCAQHGSPGTHDQPATCARAAFSQACRGDAVNRYPRLLARQRNGLAIELVFRSFRFPLVARGPTGPRSPHSARESRCKNSRRVERTPAAGTAAVCERRNADEKRPQAVIGPRHGNINLRGEFVADGFLVISHVGQAGSVRTVLGACRLERLIAAVVIPPHQKIAAATVLGPAPWLAGILVGQRHQRADVGNEAPPLHATGLEADTLAEAADCRLIPELIVPPTDQAKLRVRCRVDAPVAGINYLERKVALRPRQDTNPDKAVKPLPVVWQRAFLGTAMPVLEKLYWQTCGIPIGIASRRRESRDGQTPLLHEHQPRDRRSVGRIAQRDPPAVGPVEMFLREVSAADVAPRLLWQHQPMAIEHFAELIRTTAFQSQRCRLAVGKVFGSPPRSVATRERSGFGEHEGCPSGPRSFRLSGCFPPV